MAQLNIGDQAPLFSAKDCRGEIIDLGHVLAKSPVVLVFFPKAFTPG